MFDTDRPLGAVTALLALTAVTVLAQPGISSAATKKPDDSYQQCLLRALATASDDTPIGELKENCRQSSEIAAATEAATAEPTAERKDSDPATSEAETEPKGAISRRIEEEEPSYDSLFALTAYRPNYILLASYNTNLNEEAFREVFDDPSIDFDKVETQFQISFKFPLARNLFDGKADIFAAYTNRSFWQLYNSDISAPFRETNHEPELWIQHNSDWTLGGFRNVTNKFGFNHQSNGRGTGLSRSWNRLYAEFLFEKGELGLSLKPWWRIPESDSDDDNPDITDYLGYGEIRGAYKLGDNVFSVMIRNYLESGFSKGTTELGWSFGLWDYKHLRGYVQFFNGYGLSLIDYDRNNTTIGIGLMLNDWL